MNTARKSIYLAVASLLLAACASTPRTELATSNAYRTDARYVEAVERASRSAGVRVVWVNPPRNADRED